MKRLIPIIIGTLVFSGCSGNPISKTRNLDSSFTAEAKISVGAESFSGRLSRISENNWELIITEPFALEGLTAVIDENGTRLKMLGMEASADFSDSALSAVKLISDAFDSAVKNTVTDLVSTGTNENGSYTLILSEDGYPSEINLPEFGISVTVSEWEEITETGDDEAKIE